MKVYNRKGLLLGGICMLLALWNLVHDFGSPDPNALVQVRDSILSVFLLLLGITSFWRAFSKKATREDQIEERDERNRLIRYKSKARMLDIAYGVLFVFMVCGMIGFKLTANPVWFAILVLPGLFLGGFLILEIFVQLYYEKHE